MFDFANWVKPMLGAAMASVCELYTGLVIAVAWRRPLLAHEVGCGCKSCISKSGHLR